MIVFLRYISFDNLNNFPCFQTGFPSKQFSSISLPINGVCVKRSHSSRLHTYVVRVLSRHSFIYMVGCVLLALTLILMGAHVRSSSSAYMRHRFQSVIVWHDTRARFPYILNANADSIIIHDRAIAAPIAGKLAFVCVCSRPEVVEEMMINPPQAQQGCGDELKRWLFLYKENIILCWKMCTIVVEI